MRIQGLGCHGHKNSAFFVGEIRHVWWTKTEIWMCVSPIICSKIGLAVEYYPQIRIINLSLPWKYSTYIILHILFRWVNQSVLLCLSHVSCRVASGWVRYLGSIRCKTRGSMYWPKVELMHWETIKGFTGCLSHTNFQIIVGGSSNTYISINQLNITTITTIWRVLKHKYVNIPHVHSP